ncbi:MAG: prephenate dehydrogenase [Bacteroidales bacterium]|jgi:prephenate dehydrogenase|nr:prephenate dehydrogenase [Bacteroidales bacterium]
MTISVIGIGLIGGSLMIDLRKRGFANRIIGVDSNLQHRNIAELCGLVDETDSLENAVDKSDLIILSAPVDINCILLPAILDRIAGTKKIVTDMGSTKASIARASENHPARGRFVAVHPMAGTEFSGPLAAIGKLFDYKIAIICDKEKSDPDALKTVDNMLSVLNMRKLFMNSSDHDIHVAYVSHISHITSFSLALSVLEKESKESNILALAAGGFESTVRLAKSSAETWAPIFCENAGSIIEVIDTYIEKMNRFRKLISEKDMNGLRELMEEANKIRKILH